MQKLSPVTPAQREEAVRFLQDAYATERLSTEDFEERIERALLAETRPQLNQSLRGVAPVVVEQGRREVVPYAYPPVVDTSQHFLAGVTHLTPMVLSVFGPLLVKSATRPGSRVWWEAGRALSFQLTMALVTLLIMVGVLISGTAEWLLFTDIALWGVGTVTLAIRAFMGLNSTSPIRKVLLFQPKRPRPMLEQ